MRAHWLRCQRGCSDKLSRMIPGQQVGLPTALELLRLRCTCTLTAALVLAWRACARRRKVAAGAAQPLPRSPPPSRSPLPSPSSRRRRRLAATVACITSACHSEGSTLAGTARPAHETPALPAQARAWQRLLPAWQRQPCGSPSPSKSPRPSAHRGCVLTLSAFARAQAQARERQLRPRPPRRRARRLADVLRLHLRVEQHDAL